MCHRSNDLYQSDIKVSKLRVELLELLCILVKSALESGDDQQRKIALEKFHQYETKYGWNVDNPQDSDTMNT